ncbi:hypothetical protein DYU05_04965 [Mucilaginibacter terrenus]|uniref:Uncharacterized protein n=1 Tax=Mucilaginibacter terrenus TaxID=2482727 RepID=A0A3E2NVS5_9SPHI|nr:hypothetical protein [Mucilaginibacter terrenus]RFZ84960.1 hypothetical protein DYU05_04965 [Mucilaginibacter terrenus]
MKAFSLFDANKKSPCVNTGAEYFISYPYLAGGGVVSLATVVNDAGGGVVSFFNRKADGGGVVSFLVLSNWPDTDFFTAWSFWQEYTPIAITAAKIKGNIFFMIAGV